MQLSRPCGYLLLTVCCCTDSMGKRQSLISSSLMWIFSGHPQSPEWINRENKTFLTAYKHQSFMKAQTLRGAEIVCSEPCQIRFKSSRLWYSSHSRHCHRAVVSSGYFTPRWMANQLSSPDWEEHWVLLVWFTAHQGGEEWFGGNLGCGGEIKVMDCDQVATTGSEKWTDEEALNLCSF